MNDDSSYSSMFIAIFSSILLVLVMLSVIKNGDTMTFTSFLDFLSSNSSTFDFVNYVDYSIVGDWGLFNFLRDFFNLFIQVLNLAIYLTKIFIALIKFFLVLLAWVFA